MARHELALIRVSAIMGLVMIGGMSNLFYTQMAGILTVSEISLLFIWISISFCRSSSYSSYCLLLEIVVRKL